MSLVSNKPVLVFSGRALKSSGDYSTPEIWSSDIIDAIVNESREKRLLPERKKNITVVGEKVEYKPTQNYFIARNMIFKPFRRKWRKATDGKAA